LIASGIFDHPGFLLLVAFIALVRWLVSKAKSQAQNRQSENTQPQDTRAPVAPPPVRPISRGGETQTEEERVRRFLEALGQPAGTTPPKVTPRPRPVVPKIFPQLPPLKTAPPPLPVQKAARAVPPPPLPAEITTVRSLGADYQVQDFQRQTSSEPPPDRGAQAGAGASARIKLRTPQDLRTAIVLREIFGPPRSLQPSDLTSGV
jgi:hypothetical protein